MNVASVSSGVSSAYTWALTRQEDPQAVGLFADVNGEHPDNYRFLAETHEAIGGRLVRLDNGGKTIWDVMCEGRFLANTRVDLCSRVLKREAIAEWLGANAPGSTVWLGFDHSEQPRFFGTDGPRPRRGHREGYEAAGYGCRAPMIEREEDRGAADRWLAGLGIEAPLLTRLGFSHANCGGGCVKAGAKQFRRLLRLLPEWYAWWEAGEERVRRHLGRNDIAILRDRRGGTVRPLTLRELRLAVEAAPDQAALFDADDRDQCGCFTLFGDESAA